MKLHLYKTVDSTNVINKRLTDELIIDINLKRDVNITNPEIVLKGDFRGFNYGYIPELNRYYLIDNMEQLNLRMVKLSFVCDVLETYKEQILNSNCDFIRDFKDGDKSVIVPESNFNDVEKFNSNIVLDKEQNILLTTVSVN